MDRSHLRGGDLATEPVVMVDVRCNLHVMIPSPPARVRDAARTRHARGLIPYISRKRLLKYDGLVMPQRRAMAATG